MASARKKLDEKHLKVLRMLASSSCNKYCFDCHQRGPTYVNVTIGSFVCTKCSGILRGLTPPHRVKSMSMATFTQEEVDQLMSKGNEYCQKVWLALCESDPPMKDEQQIRDFMIDKYEKKRYYVEPGIAMKMSTLNGIKSSSQNNSTPSATSNTLSNNMSSTAVIKIKSEAIMVPPPKENNNSRLYMNGIVNGFDKPHRKPFIDPFESTNQPQLSFANFDNAPIFNATSTVPGTGSLMTSALSVSQPSTVPTEDRYAALKDLDSQMKSQFAASNPAPAVQQQEPAVVQPPISTSDPWGNNSVQVGSPPTANGIWSAAPVLRPKESAKGLNGCTSNPFANDNWITENGLTNGEVSKNPFKNSKLFSDWPGSNGISEMTVSQSFSNFQWIPNGHANPFSVGGFTGSPGTNSVFHSSNPFL